VALAALVLLVGGFVGGLESQKRWGAAATAAAGFGGGQSRSGYAGSPRGFPGGADPSASAAAAVAGTTGTVKLVDGTTIYVQTADGEVVIVKTDAKTTVAAAKEGRLADVKAGQPVTVQGAAGPDGTVTATSVTTRP
jgi:hypothetical protein